MALFCLITVSLSIYYSYTWDYQPQGRYILPVLIPLMFLVTSGVQKLCGLLEKRMPGKGGKAPAGTVLGKLLCAGIMAYVLLAFLYSLFRCLLPYYSHVDGLFSEYQLF